MSIAGHVSQRMLAHYSHVRIEAKRKALDALAVGANGKVTTQRATQNRRKQPFTSRKCLKRMAGTTGLEPAASAVTALRE